jgi:hypothetical protein
MTKDKAHERDARARAARTGDSYTRARRRARLEDRLARDGLALIKLWEHRRAGRRRGESSACA